MTNATPQHRNVSGSQFGDNSNVNLGDFALHYYQPHRPARAAIRALPYPRNEDVVHRRDIIDKLERLLPQGATEYYSVALHGLGGSGKTQIALDYAYRRCSERDCSVFWVHADSEATFVHDFQIIAKRLGVDTSLGKEDLLITVRHRIETLEKWVLVLHNADDLLLFGVVSGGQRTVLTSLFDYVPRAPSGTILWTSRDERIAGTLVGPRRGIKVGSMIHDESVQLLQACRNTEAGEDLPASTALVEELQWLPLAIAQAGAYMRRTPATVQEYLEILKKGKERWEILAKTELDRHRRPDAPNSVLETWSISIERLRKENETACRMMYIIA